MPKRPRISVTERAQQTAAVLDSDPRYRKGIESPFGLPSEGIALKDKSRTCRWMNDELMGGGNVWRKKQIGYDPVKVEDLEFPEQIGAYNVNPAGEVTRGARGQEVLMMLPSAVYESRQMAKAKKNMADMRDFDKQKTDMVNATAARFGGEAGDYVNQHVGPVGRVQTSYERIAVNETEEE
jgi:hypothetical protein